MTPWIQTVTGRALVLSAPAVEPSHLWSEIAVGLSHIARFAGQTDAPYSVAQHSVLMAESALDETGDPLLAAHCLLHGGHEAYIGGRPSPMKAAVRDELATAIAFLGGDCDAMDWAKRALATAEKAVEARIDKAIFTAAGLSMPDGGLEERIRAFDVRAFDIRALATERKHLMLPPPQPWLPPEVETCVLLRPRGGALRIWPPGKALERFSRLLAELCPTAARACGRDLVHDTTQGAA